MFSDSLIQADGARKREPPQKRNRATDRQAGIASQATGQASKGESSTGKAARKGLHTPNWSGTKRPTDAGTNRQTGKAQQHW